MGGFPHAVIIGIIAAIITFFGIAQKNRGWILAGMLLSLTTASPMLTFTTGAEGAIVPSDLVAFILLLGLLFGGFNGMSSPIVPNWRRPYIILVILWVLSIILIASWNMPDLMQTFGWKARSILPLPLNVQITGFRLFRIGLLMAFFLVISRLAIEEYILNRVLFYCWLIAVCLATAQILHRFGVADLRLSSVYAQEFTEMGEYVLGYTKAATNRILFVGFFIALIMTYKSKVFKMWYIASAFLIVLSILLSGNRAGIVGLAIGIIVLTFRTKAAYIPLVLISTLFLTLSGFYAIYKLQPEALERFAIFLPGSGLSSHRMEIVTWTFEYVTGHLHVLLTGVGFMNYRYALRPVGSISDHAHNDILTCLTETGLIGLGVFIWWLSSLLRTIWSVGRKAIGYERWFSACINAAFLGLLSVMLVEQTFFPTAHTLSMNRFQIILFGSFIAYHIQKQAMEQEYLYYDDAYYEEAEDGIESYSI